MEFKKLNIVYSLSARLSSAQARKIKKKDDKFARSLKEIISISFQ